jgi:hypothetical protein
MSTHPNTAPDADASSTQMTALRWISLVVSALIVVQAFLAGQGVFQGEKNLLTGHGHLGNGIFVLVAIMIVLSFLAFQKGQIGRNHLLLNGLIMVLLFAQIGLGYSGRESTGAASWHLPNGVLLMGASTVNAVLFWVRSSMSGDRQNP